MNVPAFLGMLRDRDIQVCEDGGRLRCNAPPGTLTPELRDELRRRKDEVLQFLRSAGSLARQQHAIVPLQPHGTRPPIFAFGGHNGDVFCFRALAQHLAEDQPLFGLQPPGLDGRREPLTRVEDLAAHFAAEIQAAHPNGPYVIAGFCAGGAIAFELARHLHREGASLEGLALFGAPYPTAYRRLPRLRRRVAAQAERLLNQVRALALLATGQRQSCLAEKFCQRDPPPAPKRSDAPDPVLAQRAKVAHAIFAALRCYVPGRFDGPLSLFLPCRAWANSLDQPLRWRSLAAHTEEYFGPDGCSTDTMLREPYAAVFAELFRQSTTEPPNRSLRLLKPTPLPSSGLDNQQMKPLPL